jgi:signal transduction histidine kinase
MNEMQTKYETEKKEQQLKLKSIEIEQHKYKNKVQIILFLGLALLIISVFGFVFYRNKQRQKAELIKENNRQDKLRFKAVIDSEEKERIRVAKELHDGLGQLLSSAKLNISSLEDGIQKEDEYLLKNSLTILDDAVNEVRNISHNMMPTALMNYGIVEALAGLVNKINDSKQITIVFNNNDFNITLDKETEITLYRIIQELINNMLKHSKATQIDICLLNSQNQIQLSIKDNGIGFNVSEIEHSKGIGWQNIYSRVSMLNGKILVNSQLGNGTEISITILV